MMVIFESLEIVTYSQILPNGLQLITRIVVILIGTPFFLYINQRVGEHLDRSHLRRRRRLGETQKRFL